MAMSTPPLLARMVTEILAPWVLVLSLPMLVAWHATGNPLQTLVWGLVVGVTGSVIPMAVVVHGARRGQWDGHHVTNREGRLVPLFTCAASLGTGIAVLLLGNAPHRMLALSLSMFLSLVVSIAITFAAPVPGGGRGWKISVHTAVAAGALAVLVVTFGLWTLVFSPAVALVGWSRVALGDHTVAQVVGGVALGLVVGGLTFWWLA
ncbi:membrane-associated phospholipid phosphatase [Saccharothrix tamanrassetensis]|uniref:Membrane-associated phospholipid phosphatase n=1 Tax=Saccharothrix tamanrassetensis TaxID=1051531 RepID=A0A841CQ84_9PSEU|nr:phosphatase PAP2 family protein [Saccharothrix tamanrassetensis]MBB5959380.1 membrane-associated phospholipid phosphatase [Saccharothrix tamanrassetensis]